MATKQIIFPQGETGQTFFAKIRRRADLFWLNDANGAFAAAPADRLIAMTENVDEPGLYELFENRVPFLDGDYDVYCVDGTDTVKGSGYLPIVDDAEVTLTTQHIITFNGEIITDPTDTIRQQIITILDARLKSILTTNGYKTNLGNNVFTWRTTELQESELDAIVIREVGAEISDTPLQHQTFRSRLELATVTRTIDASLAAQKDVLKAIGTDPQWSALAINTKLVSTALSMDQREYLTFVDVITIEIIYRIPEWNQS